MAKRFINKKGQVTSTPNEKFMEAGGVREFNPVEAKTPAQARIDRDAARTQREKEIAAKAPTILQEKQVSTALGQKEEGQALTPAMIQERQIAQQRNLEEVQQLTQGLGVLTQEQQNRNVVQGEGIVGDTVGLGTATAAAGAGLVKGAALGAAAGPVGAGVGAAVGAAAGFVAGTYVKISPQRRQDVKQAYTVFTQSKGNLNWIINQVNAGTMSRNQAIELWDENLSNLYAAERHLKQETATNLDRFISGGSDELARVEAYKQRLPTLQAQLVTALVQPDPTKILQDLEIGDGSLNVQ